MTLLYGKDANGNQVPLLVSANGTVQTSGLWSGTSSQLTAGDGSAVTVGTGLTLVGNTLAASGASFSTVWDVDWKAQTPATFSTVLSTATISGVTCSFQSTLVAGGTGTYTLSAANGLRATKTNAGGQFAGTSWADLTSLNLKMHKNIIRWWTLWDASAGSAWTSPALGDEAFTGYTATSPAYSYHCQSIRKSNITTSGGTGFSPAQSISNALTQAADVHVIELDPVQDKWTMYTGTSVGGNWPSVSALNKTLVLELPSAYYTNGGTALFLGNGFTSNNLLLATNGGSLGVLRSRIDTR